MSDKYERAPEPTVDFFDVTQRLPEGDSLILGKQKVTFVGEDHRAYRQAPVRYQGLSYLSDIHRSLSADSLVTQTFIPAAKRSGGDIAREPSRLYPLLRVVNDKTADETQETFDVARLITAERLPVYSSRLRVRGGGEMLTLGVESLVRNMAEKVGVPSVGLVVKLGDAAVSVREATPEVKTRLARTSWVDTFDEATDFKLHALKARGRNVLKLIQADAAEAFRTSDFRANEFNRPYATVALSVDSQPNLDNAMLELIDIVESWGGKLTYRMAMYATESYGPLLSATVGPYGGPVSLAHEEDLDLSILNAYLAAKAF